MQFALIDLMCYIILCKLHRKMYKTFWRTHYWEEGYMVCCLFGHKETPASVAAELGKVIDHLIQERGVDEFLVGIRALLTVWFTGHWERHAIGIRIYPIGSCLLICQTQNQVYMNIPKLFSRRELRRYRLASQFPGAINGWFGNQISVYVISHIPGVVQQRV